MNGCDRPVQEFSAGSFFDQLQDVFLFDIILFACAPDPDQHFGAEMRFLFAVGSNQQRGHATEDQQPEGQECNSFYGSFLIQEVSFLYTVKPTASRQTHSTIFL